MLKEIYCRQSNDTYADQSLLEHSNVREAILAKIRMILTTPRGSVIGEPMFGVDLEQYIFETSFSATKIEEAINTQISMFMPEAADFHIRVKVELMKGEVYDTGLVSIYIDGEKMMGILVN